MACAVKVIEIDSGECVNTIVGHMDAIPVAVSDRNYVNCNDELSGL